MKTYKIIILSLLFVSASFAQSLKEGPEVLREDRTIHFLATVDADASGFYGWAQGKGGDLYLEKYDPAGKQLFSAKTDNVTATICAGNNFYLLHARYDQSTQKKTLSIEQVAAKGNFENQSIIDEIDIEPTQQKYVNFFISMSPDNKKVMVVSQKQVPEQPEATTFRWYDAVTMKRIWQKSLVAEQKNGFTQTSAYKVDNEGNLLLTATFGASPKDLASFNNTTTTMGIVKAQTGIILPFTFQLEDGRNISTKKVKIGNDGIAIIGGTFQDPATVKSKTEIIVGNAGVYFVKVNMATGEVQQPISSYYSPEVEKQITYKSPGGEFPAAKNITPVQIVALNNAFYMVSEYSFISGNAVNPQAPVVFISNNELIITKLNEHGKIEWTKVIPKATTYRKVNHTRMEEYSVVNYNMMKSGNKLNIVFLENPKNTKRFSLDNFSMADMSDLNTAEKGNLVCVSLDEAGTLTKKILQPADDFYCIPQYQDAVIPQLGLVVFLKKGAKEKFAFID